MKVSVKNVGTCRKTMKVEVPAAAVQEERTQLLEHYTQGVALPGFRKGKAPKHLVENKFAKEMDADLKERLVPKYYHEALEAEGVKVVTIVEVGEPELTEDQLFTFEVTFDVAPEFKLPKYQGISIKAEKTDVTDTQVDETIDRIRRQHATFDDIEGRPAEEKDMVQVSYEATIDGEPLEEKVPEARGLGKGAGYWITCDEESFIPGMGVALIGTSIGDKKELDVEFPESFIVKELAGQKAHFKVEVTGMRESKLPEFDEEFLKQLQVDSEEELRTNVRQHLEEAAQQKEDRRREETVYEFLLKKTKIDVSETAIQDQTRTVMYEMARTRMMQGMSQEQVQAQTPDMMEEAKVKGEEQVKLRYIMVAIAEAEGITVDDPSISEEIARMAIQGGRDAAEVRKEIEKEGRMNDVADQLRFSKAVKFLLENAKVK